MYKKPVIVFEGIEGSGKTSHINYISRDLKKRKLKFIKLREPGGSFNSEKIRKLLLNKKNRFDKLTDLFLYLSARNENIKNLLTKNYKKKIILIDRFSDSTLAYQYYGMGIDYRLIQQINKIIVKNFKVDFTFYNIVNSSNLKKRLRKRQSLNRYDMFKFSFYNKVQKGFLILAKKNKKSLIVDSNRPMEKNKHVILNKVKKLLN